VEYRIRSLRDRQQFNDPEGEAEGLGITSANWPLFGQAWPSGRVLAAAMHSFPIEGKRILEMGCGLALSSLVLHRRGADITASDNHPLAATFLAEDLRLNHPGPIKFHTGDWSDTGAAPGQFDLIIGSDVLYERGQPQVLSDFIDRHSGHRVEVIIVDPNRGNRAKFNQRMARLGYAHSEARAPARQTDGVHYKGRILTYRRDLDG
jgi:ETFB lysine methyltransferase